MSSSNGKQICLLGVDVGTSALKAVILDGQAQQIAASRSSYRFTAPGPGWAEIGADSLWAALLSCVKDLRDESGVDLSLVSGIGLSVLSPALVLTDEAGNALADPIPYSDRRSAKQAEEIKARAGEERLFELTANGSMAGGLTGSSLLWLRENRPEAFGKARWYGSLNSWLTLRMTGRTAIDPTNASYTNLFDVTRGAWSGELCAALEIDPAKLSPVKQAYEAAGVLKDRDLTGLGLREGIPVAAGAGDVPCAALAAGVTGPGLVCESAGSSNVLTVCTDTPLFDPRLINRCHIVPGTWTVHGSMSFTGASLAWFAREFYGTDDVTGTLNDAASARPGCSGTVFLPYLQGERSPVWDPDARGVFLGLTLAASRADMARAVLESCGYGLRQFLDIAEDLTGKRIGRFVSIGGGTRSGLWTQIKADITGCVIEVPEQREMSASGAALLAGVSAGVWPDVQTAAAAMRQPAAKVFVPDHAHDGIYARNYEVYCRLYPALKDLFAENQKDIPIYKY